MNESRARGLSGVGLKAPALSLPPAQSSPVPRL
jgi:hypothetical protein